MSEYRASEPGRRPSEQQRADTAAIQRRRRGAQTQPPELLMLNRARVRRTGVGAIDLRRRMTPAARGRLVHHLQRSQGNQAVGRLLRSAPKSGMAARPTSPAAARSTGGAGGGGGSALQALAQSPSDLDLVQRKEAGPGMALLPPVEPKPRLPEEDPKFKKVEADTKKKAKDLKKHPPAAGEAKKAQDAAKAPPDDKESQAKAKQAEKMAAAKPKGFDKAAFIAAVKKSIAAKAPKNLEEADKFGDSGKAGEVKSDVMGQVQGGKKASAGEIESTTKAAPDTSKAKDKPVKPLKEEPVKKPEPPAGAKAMPDKVPPEQTNLAAGPAQVKDEMAQEEVTDETLKKSNEPEFEQAADAKQKAQEHSEKAPAEFRKAESAKLAAAEKAAAGSATKSTNVMFDSKGKIAKKVAGKKTATQSKDEAERAKVSSTIKSIFDKTKQDVEKILTGLDDKVTKAFETGESAARAKFTQYHKQKMKEYKDDRYSGVLGWGRWVKDKFKGLPPAGMKIFTDAKQIYESEMEKVISNVADIVGNELTAAKTRIATGRGEVDKYVASLPKNLQKVGKDAAKEVGSEFDQLEKDVDSKQDSLVEDLASKYVEAAKAVDEEVKKLQDENKGLIDKAIGAIKGVIETIRNLKNMLMNVLAKAAAAIKKIIADPIGFLSNLIAGIKGGIMKFKDNILTHLKKGLMSWLFGALAESGIELPETFDIKGILKLLLSIFGLTWTNIRARLVKAIGAPAMDAIEKGVKIFQVLATEGPAGLWQMILEKIGDIKEMILEKVKEFVIEKIIVAGITWLIGLLNPAAAFIKACKMIYDVVMFFVQNASRIMKFVNTVIDSVTDIANGNVSGVVNKIESVLGQMVPIIIGFLASVLGLGGIGKKIRSIVETLQKPVNKAIDWVIKTGLKLAGPIIRAVQKGKDWAKGKVKGAKDALVKLLKPEQASVDMAGAGHTLSATPTPGGGATVEIATTKGPVRKKVGAAKQLFAQGTPKPKKGQLDALDEIDAAAQKVEKLTADATKAGKAKTLLEHPGFADAFNELRLAINRYGRRFGSKDIKPADIDDDRLKLAGEVGVDMQALAGVVRNEFMAKPSLALAELTPGEIKIEKKKPFLWRCNFGKAVERRMATKIANSPKLAPLLKHVGGAGRPDWVGKNAITGAKYDVTTDNEGTIYKHENREWWDKQRDILITYVAPPSKP